MTKIKKDIAQALSILTSVPTSELEASLELPKDFSMGDLAFPCFGLAKKQKKSPMAIATELAAQSYPSIIAKSVAVGGYLNFYFQESLWQQLVFGQVQDQGAKIGDNKEGEGRCVVLDYSSPNVAKPMSIGHLRSTVIGQSLTNLFKACGYKTVGINYIGDWGVQFGKLAWAHLNPQELERLIQLHGAKIIENGFNKDYWNKLVQDSKQRQTVSFDYLFAIYVIFHALADLDPNLDDHGRRYFLTLEQRRQNPNDPKTKEIVASWEEFIQVSLKEYKKVYAILNTQHDLVRGESFYEDQLKDVVQELKDKKLLTLSQGAQVVDLEPYAMTPCLIQKTDGATLYATRDIAAALNRKFEFKADKLIYVVGAEQTLHFKQFFKVLELMGHDWVKDCEHVAFGLYRFKEGKMSTRRGNVVLLEDVLDRAIELVQQIIAEKNPDLKNADIVARQVGTAAVVFNDLMNDRVKNIDFDWDKLLDFNGDTGPYVQYAHVRCCSVIEKWKKQTGIQSIPKFDAKMPLIHALEKQLVHSLSQFEDVIHLSLKQLKPSWMAHYLLQLAKAFNSFYYEHRILEGDLEYQKSRIILVQSTQLILQKGLNLLGIQAPTAM